MCRLPFGHSSGAWGDGDLAGEVDWEGRGVNEGRGEQLLLLSLLGGCWRWTTLCPLHHLCKLSIGIDSSPLVPLPSVGLTQRQTHRPEQVRETSTRCFGTCLFVWTKQLRESRGNSVSSFHGMFQLQAAETNKWNTLWTSQCWIRAIRPKHNMLATVSIIWFNDKCLSSLLCHKNTSYSPFEHHLSDVALRINSLFMQWNICLYHHVCIFCVRLIYVFSLHSWESLDIL